MRAAAEQMDKIELTVLEKLLGMTIPLQGKGLSWERPLFLPIARARWSEFPAMGAQAANQNGRFWIKEQG